MQKQRVLITLVLVFGLPLAAAMTALVFPGPTLQFVLNRTGHRTEGLQMEIFSSHPKISFAIFELDEPPRFVRLRDVHVSVDTALIDVQAGEIEYRDEDKPALVLRDELTKIGASVAGGKDIAVSLRADLVSVQLSASSDPIIVRSLAIKNFRPGGKPSCESIDFRSDMVELLPDGRLSALVSSRVFADVAKDFRFVFSFPADDARLREEDLHRLREEALKASPEI